MARPAPPAAREICDAILARHGDSVTAVLFYGSCLRKENSEGVLDFYVLVDRYRSAYASRWLALQNAILPPNVFYLEMANAGTTLRAKYAVLSERRFQRAVGAKHLHPYVWARFAQPTLLAYARDAETRDHLAHCVARSIVTLVQRLSVFMPAKGRVQRFSLAAMWLEALRRTYGAEIRPEAPETIRSLYGADSARYDRVAGEAFTVLESEGRLDRVSTRGNAVEIEMDPRRRARLRWRWRLALPIAKLIAFLRLLKSAGTFGDWLPYALWKLERHTGVRIEPSERQLRHPLIFGWPVILRLLFGGKLY